MSVLDKFVSKDATLSMPVTSYQVLLEQAALDERERIIKMLKSTDSHLIVFDTGKKKSENRIIHSPKCGICASIALIRDENNAA